MSAECCWFAIVHVDFVRPSGANFDAVLVEAEINLYETAGTVRKKRTDHDLRDSVDCKSRAMI